MFRPVPRGILRAQAAAGDADRPAHGGTAMSLDWVQDIGGSVCRLVITSARCYDPHVMTSVGTATFAAGVGLLMAAWFASKTG